MRCGHSDAAPGRRLLAGITSGLPTILYNTSRLPTQGSTSASPLYTTIDIDHEQGASWRSYDRASCHAAQNWNLTRQPDRARSVDTVERVETSA